MADMDLILLSVAVILTGYLYLRHRQRARDCPPEKQWTGHGIDASGISDRVDRVRNDYVAELQSRSRGVCRRRDLLTLSRQVVVRLPYIRDRAALKTASKERETDNFAARQGDGSLDQAS
jgi:hypothetical protein